MTSIEEKTVVWIEPDEDDFELFSEKMLELNVRINVLRYKTLHEAIPSLENLLNLKIRWFVITEYYRFWVDDLGKLEQIVTRVTDRHVPVIVFTGNQNPQIAETFPNFEFIQKPFGYTELGAIIPKIIELGSSIDP